MGISTQNINHVAYAHVALPSDAFPLVAELVHRLGGNVTPIRNSAPDTVIIPPIPEQERVGRMLKGLRLRAGMTQKQLALAIGVPQSHISEYEANKRLIPAVKVPLLAKILHTVESHFIPRA